jgi:hypothetical protein
MEAGVKMFARKALAPVMEKPICRVAVAFALSVTMICGA